MHSRSIDANFYEINEKQTPMFLNLLYNVGSNYYQTHLNVPNQRGTQQKRTISLNENKCTKSLIYYLQTKFNNALRGLYI